VRQERILGTGDFVERMVSETGKPSRQDSPSSFRDNGAIGKGVRNVIGRGGAIIGRLHVGHFLKYFREQPKKAGSNSAQTTTLCPICCRPNLVFDQRNFFLTTSQEL
jgi:hypothetical protein